MCAVARVWRSENNKSWVDLFYLFLNHWVETQISVMTESTFIHRPALLSLAVIKIFIKRNLGREETMYLVYIVQVTVHEEIKGRNLRHEPGGRNWSKHHRRLLPTCLFHLTCSTCFLIPCTTCPGATTHCGMEPPTFIINQVNGPQTGLQNIMLEAFFLFGSSLFQESPSWCQVDENTSQLTSHLAFWYGFSYWTRVHLHRWFYLQSPGILALPSQH